MELPLLRLIDDRLQATDVLGRNLVQPALKSGPQCGPMGCLPEALVTEGLGDAPERPRQRRRARKDERALGRGHELFATQVREVGQGVLPDFAYAVDDLRLATDDDLRQRSLPDEAKVTLWLMRDVLDRAALHTNLAGGADVLERIAHSPRGDEALSLLLRYVALASGDLQLSEFRDILKGRAPAVEIIAMTIAELLEAKVLAAGRVAGLAAGRAEGLAAGRAEGLAAGRTEGLAAGRAEGEATGVANSIFMVLTARKLHVSDEARSRITGCANVETLDHWLVRAATVTSADDVFED